MGKLLLPHRRHWPYWVAAACCAALPSADALGYRLGVPYDSLWAHRGLTHSLLASEALWVGLPCALALAIAARHRRPPPTIPTRV